MDIQSECALAALARNGQKIEQELLSDGSAKGRIL
jgi:hypothetical protein